MSQIRNVALRQLNGVVRLLGLKREELRLAEGRITAGDAAIDQHLPGLYWEVVTRRPGLVVEVGTRGGASTRALVAAAGRSGSTVVSIDPNPTTFSTDYPHWHFIQGFGQEVALQFPDWCQQHGLEPDIEFWFLDSSHEYDESLAELRAWRGLWAPDVLLAFHDTVMAEWYRRSDGTVGRGWDNEAGVSRAIEEELAVALDWETPLVTSVEGWHIRHTPYSSGFSYAQRSPGGAPAQ